MATRAGFLDGNEVVEVWFDPAVLTFAQLVAGAATSSCAERVWTTTDAQLQLATKRLGERAATLASTITPDREPKYHLLHTDWRHVPMSALQATRLNAALAPAQQGKASAPQPADLLSPRQFALFDAARSAKPAWPIAVDRELRAAWDALRAAREPAPTGR